MKGIQAVEQHRYVFVFWKSPSGVYVQCGGSGATGWETQGMPRRPNHSFMCLIKLTLIKHRSVLGTWSIRSHRRTNERNSSRIFWR